MDEGLISFFFLSFSLHLFLSIYHSFLQTTNEQEIGFTHLRISQGLTTLLQLSALVAKLCSVATKFEQMKRASVPSTTAQSQP
jgi:hypothetical protein